MELNFCNSTNTQSFLVLSYSFSSSRMSQLAIQNILQFIWKMALFCLFPRLSAQQVISLSSRMPAFDFSSWYALFFIAFVIVNTYIFMSLFLAVVYNNYKKHLKVIGGGVNCDQQLPAVLCNLAWGHLASPWQASARCGEGEQLLLNKHTASSLHWFSANKKHKSAFHIMEITANFKYMKMKYSILVCLKQVGGTCLLCLLED